MGSYCSLDSGVALWTRLKEDLNQDLVDVVHFGEKALCLGVVVRLVRVVQQALICILLVSDGIKGHLRGFKRW